MRVCLAQMTGNYQRRISEKVESELLCSVWFSGHAAESHRGNGVLAGVKMNMHTVRCVTVTTRMDRLIIASFWLFRVVLSVRTCHQ